MKFLTNGELQFSLYHQTSSVFVDSIKKHGFCGVNIIQKFEVLESLNNISSYAEKNKIELPFDFSLMSRQTSRNGFNFRHGGGYVTPSQGSAVRYATNNKYGSEIISHVLAFAEELTRNGHIINELLSSDLLELAKTNPFPVLLEITNTPISTLQGENQENFEEVMKHIIKLNFEPGDKLFEIMTQQLNFEVISPLGIERINMYQIEFDTPVDHIFPKYSLVRI